MRVDEEALGLMLVSEIRTGHHGSLLTVNTSNRGVVLYTVG